MKEQFKFSSLNVRQVMSMRKTTIRQVTALLCPNRMGPWSKDLSDYPHSRAGDHWLWVSSICLLFIVTEHETGGLTGVRQGMGGRGRGRGMVTRHSHADHSKQP